MAQALGALCLGSIGFLPLTPSIIWLIIAQQFFSGLMMPASSAAMYDLTTTENRKTAFILMYLALNPGYAVRPILAGILYETHANWLFPGDAGTTFLSLLFVVFLLSETLGSAEIDSDQSAEKTEKGSTLSLLVKKPVLLRFVVAMALPWFIYGQHSFTLPIFSKELCPITGVVWTLSFYLGLPGMYRKLKNR